MEVVNQEFRALTVGRLVARDGAASDESPTTTPSVRVKRAAAGTARRGGTGSEHTPSGGRRWAAVAFAGPRGVGGSESAGGSRSGCALRASAAGSGPATGRLRRLGRSSSSPICDRRLGAGATSRPPTGIRILAAGDFAAGPLGARTRSGWRAPEGGGGGTRLAGPGE